MSRTSHPLRRTTVLAATVPAVLLATAAQASAMRSPEPGPADPGVIDQGPGKAVLYVTNHSVSALQWVLLAAIVIGALAVGAAAMHLSQRHQAQPAR